MNPQTRHRLAELARVAGVTPRTVRYYIAQGLLPGAHDAGPGAWYDDGHLTRLRLIRDLQRQHLPLAEIRSKLATLGDDEVAELVAERSKTPDPVSGSALDYIRGVLGGATAGAGRCGRQRPTLPELAIDCHIVVPIEEDGLAG